MNLRRFKSALLLPCAAASLLAPAITGAEDIDIFVGGQGGATSANVLIVLDNTSNWSQQAQHWPGGITQGQSELLAIKAAVAALDDTVNVGLMMFTDNGSGREGGYVRYAMRPMNATNRTNLQNLLQQIYNNFGTPAEKVASSANYSATLFDAYKYFGGYTSPAHAHDDVAGSPLGATAFGTQVYATTSNIPAANADVAGYTDSSLTFYQPPAPADGDTCGGKDYVVFIGNGFPNADTNPQANLKTFLEGVGGDSSQLPLNTFTTTTTNTPQTPTFLSAACYDSSISGKNSGLSQCNTDYGVAATCGTSYDSCVCATPTDPTGCGVVNKKQLVKFTVTGYTSVTVVNPTGTSAPPANNIIRYPDEWTRFMFQTDVNSAAGQQNVTTYTIDVFNAQQDGNQTALLYSMANNAGGKYFPAKSQSAIEIALKDIFQEIQSVNSTFASASLPVSTTNRAQNLNQVFIGMFRPDPDLKPRWYGNMKRFQIKNFSGDYKLADVNGLDALNTLTGFFTDCSTSFWTADSGKFWSGVATNPSPAGGCTAPATTFDAFSDSPDGPIVEKGAVAEVLRRGNDPTATNPTWALNRTVYTNSFAAYSTASSGMAANDVNFILGNNIDSSGNSLTYTFKDPSGADQTTSIRPSIHGDVIHSRPLPVNYGGTTGTVVYYGANDGTFRAVDSATGKELWAYVAPEFYSTLSRLRTNSPLVKYSFSTVSTDTPAPTPKNYYFDGSAGLYQNADNSKVWIFPTMRRGGRMIYAFDVTSPTSPSLKWKVGCPDLLDDNNCTSGMSAIGQTWSTPNAATLKIGGTVAETAAPVVVVGGGYDNCEDGAAAAACSGAKGSVVYVLNAGTGAVLNSFTTTGRVAADVALVDLDFDNIPDLAYVVDTRGNVYRVNFGLSKTAPLAAANYTMTRIAYTSGANRKFFYPPALLPAYDKATDKNFVYVALGSGDREQPLASQYPYTTPVLNRFYVYLDDVTSTTAANLDDSTKFNDFTQPTSCTTDVLIPGSDKSGWSMDLDVCGPLAVDCSEGATTIGEQTVTSAAIVGGLVAFSTNRPVAPKPNVCAPRGEARGYLINLFNASGAVGEQGMTCGGSRSAPFAGGGLPPSPVVGNVDVDGRITTVLIGAVTQKGPTTSSSLQGQEGFTLKPQRRQRVFYRQEGNN